MKNVLQVRKSGQSHTLTVSEQSFYHGAADARLQRAREALRLALCCFMVDIPEILAKGGAQRLAFLRYCVLSMSMEPVFVFLAGEYRLRPGHAAALALFDVFCAGQAAARLPAYELLPPRELLVEAAIVRIRTQWTQMQSPQPPDEESAIPNTTSPRNLFDAIVRGVWQDAQGRLALMSSTYDPVLTPEENLPGGKLTAGQRHFVEKVWHPVVRPRLVGVGFWQIATVA